MYELPEPLKAFVDDWQGRDVKEQASIKDEVAILGMLLQIELHDLDSGVPARRRAADLASTLAKAKTQWMERLESQGQLFSVAQVCDLIRVLVDVLHKAIDEVAPEHKNAITDCVVRNSDFKTLLSQPRLLLSHTPTEEMK